MRWTMTKLSTNSSLDIAIVITIFIIYIIAVIFGRNINKYVIYKCIDVYIYIYIIW